MIPFYSEISYGFLHEGVSENLIGTLRNFHHEIYKQCGKANTNLVLRKVKVILVVSF
jgi:hypothetical protein